MAKFRATVCFIVVFAIFGNGPYAAYAAYSCTKVYTSCVSGYTLTNGNCVPNSGGGGTTCAAGKYLSDGNCNDCPALETGYRFSSVTGKTAVTQCTSRLEGDKISSLCSEGQLTKIATSADAWGTATITAALKAKPGARVNGQTCEECPLERRTGVRR